MDKLYSVTAAQMKALLDRKEVTSVEITNSVIDRIEKTDGEIQAYTSYNFEQALQQAAAADEKRAKGESSVELHLIRGIDKQHPSWYRACVVPEIPLSHTTEGQYIVVMCRKHTMTPNDTSNLDNFERVYSRFGNCQLVAVAIDEQMHINMNIDFSEAIELKKVIITDAWKVSVHEPTRNTLEWDDDPIIPESESTTAPVIELMKNLREVHDKMKKRNIKTVKN